MRGVVFLKPQLALATYSSASEDSQPSSSKRRGQSIGIALGISAQLAFELDKRYPVVGSPITSTSWDLSTGSRRRTQART